MTEDNYLGATSAGTVIADIGGDRGALVLYAPAPLAGAEIEISPADGGRKTHVAVRERLVGENHLYAAFYPSLAAGPYVVWTLEGRPAGTVTIVAGEVVELSIQVSPDSDRTNDFTTSPRT